MKENKIAIKWLVAIIVATFISAVVLEWKWDIVLVETVSAFMLGHRGFVINVLLGIFASGILALIIAFITYHVKKKELLNDYYIVAQRYIHETTFFYTEHFDKGTDVLTAKKNLKSKEAAIKIKDLQVLFQEIASMKSRISFYTKHNKISKQIETIDRLMGTVHLLYRDMLMVTFGINEDKILDKIINELNKDNDPLTSLKQQCTNLEIMLKIQVSFGEEKKDGE